MKRNYLKIIISSILISSIGVWVIDYFSHLLFSSPMETLSYFMAKMVFYFIFSILFLSIFDLEGREFVKILTAGIVVALIWGSYYNVLPSILDYYPAGISLRGLTFLGMGLFGTGFTFGIVHALAFIGGYYSAKFTLKNF